MREDKFIHELSGILEAAKKVQIKQEVEGSWRVTKDDYPWSCYGSNKEIFFDYLDRNNRTYNILKECVHGSWINMCKKGNMSNANAVFVKNPVTLLASCQLCGILSFRVQNRKDVLGWDFDKPNQKDSKCVLCVSCWNKVKPIVKASRQADSIRKLLTKLKREIANGKDKNYQRS